MAGRGTEPDCSNASVTIDLPADRLEFGQAHPASAPDPQGLPENLKERRPRDP